MPKVYGFCEAGCKYEVVARTDIPAKFVYLTREEYNALTEYEDDVLYYVYDEGQIVTRAEEADVTTRLAHIQRVVFNNDEIALDNSGATTIPNITLDLTSKSTNHYLCVMKIHFKDYPDDTENISPATVSFHIMGNDSAYGESVVPVFDNNDFTTTVNFVRYKVSNGKLILRKSKSNFGSASADAREMIIKEIRVYDLSAKTCTTCNGTGTVAARACSKCEGAGQVLVGDLYAPCSACNGTGKVDTCTTCNGSGTIEE